MSAKLHLAITKNDERAVLGMIRTLCARERIGLNAFNELGYTPLHACIIQGLFEAVNALLSRPIVEDDFVRLNQTTPQGDTELHLCIRKNAPFEIIWKLLDSPLINIDKANAKRKTPLSLCLRYNPRLAIELIQKGCKINGKAGRNAPIMLNKRHPQITKLLLQKGADTRVTDKFGNTPLHLAVSLDWKEVVSMLMEMGESMESWNAYGQGPLQMVRSVDTLNVLLQYGGTGTLDWTGDDGETALMTAISSSNDKLCLRLIEAKACVTSLDRCGRSMLHRCAENGSPAICNALIKARAQVDACDHSGETALHAVTDRNICNILIKAGAPLNARANDGHTALMRSIIRNHEAVCSALLDAGADTEIPDDDGNTPMLMTLLARTRTGNTWAISMLVSAGANPNAQNAMRDTILYDAYTPNDIKLLIAAKADVMNVNNKMMTPLHRQAYLGTGEIVQLIINAKADINATNTCKQTPLHRACQARNLHTMSTLLNAGASTHVVDHLGMTPLHYYAKWGQTRGVDLLMQAGAHVDVTDSSGHTPLYHAWSTTTAVRLVGYGADPNMISNSDHTEDWHHSVNEARRIYILAHHTAPLLRMRECGVTPPISRLRREVLEKVSEFDKRFVAAVQQADFRKRKYSRAMY